MILKIIISLISLFISIFLTNRAIIETKKYKLTDKFYLFFLIFLLWILIYIFIGLTFCEIQGAIK